MKRAFLLFAVLLLVSPLFGQELDMAGSWQLYRLDTIGIFSLNEYRTSPPTSSFIDATLVLEDDGTMNSDSQSLRFQAWGVDGGFLYFETPSGNSFYKVRDLTEDVLFLVSVVVTERNANVTQIEANSNANLLLVRQ
jgi:hypothetical protein